jgi:hypothetical protein
MEREKPAHDERGAPAPRRAEQSRIEEKDRGERSDGSADPEASVHGQVDASAQVRRHELLNRRVDGGIFAANARTGDEAHDEEDGKGSAPILTRWSPRHRRRA